MQYKYCEDGNFEDFASGRVIINKSGFANFPVRLGQEIYCRCLSYLKNNKNICIYDPCGGGAYLLTSLGFLNCDTIKTIVYSDISNEAFDIANQNLSLLTNEGLERRIRQLENLYKQYAKHSHSQAMESANRLKTMLDKYDSKPRTLLYKIDLISNEPLKHLRFKADIVLTDIPYGNLVSWKGNQEDAVNIFLNNLLPALKPTSIVAICSDKKQQIKLDKYARLEKHQIGKRKFEILNLK